MVNDKSNGWKDFTTKEECAAWCCETELCVAFFFTTNQSSANRASSSSGGGDLSASSRARASGFTCQHDNGNCCWIKPTFNASRTNDSSVCDPASTCHSGVLRRGLPSPLPPSLEPPATMDLVMLTDPKVRERNESDSEQRNKHNHKNNHNHAHEHEKTN